MALPQEINFRSTSGYRSDDSSDAHVQTTLSVDYPDVSSQGNNVGWETAGAEGANNVHNSGSGVDVRIGGNHYDDVDATYRIDLPSSGAHNIYAAMGDCTYGANNTLEIMDTTTSRGVIISNTSEAAHSFIDATDTEYSDANWPGSNSATEITFTTTICRFDFSTTDFWGIAHLKVESALARDQRSFRFYDDGTESGSTALAATDTDINRQRGVAFQVRVGTQTSNDAPSETVTLQYKETSDATTEWRAVP